MTVPLINAPIDGEILSPEATARVVGKTHPLVGGRVDCCVRAGSSITEILLEALSAHPQHKLRRDFIVRIDGHEIPECNWSKVRVKARATITFTPRLRGGNLLRSVLSVVVAVAAIAVAGPLGGMFAASAFGAGIGISAGVASALIAGGIMLAGTMALNALFPTRPPAAPEGVTQKSLNSIQGAQNQANTFGVVPSVLGRHRQSPFFAAKPYTEIVGDDQWLRLLFCLGYGPLNISDMKIGETPLSSFGDYQIEVRQGFANDPPTSLYPGEVNEVALSIVLENFGDSGGFDGDAGPWSSQTTSPDTDEISLDFTATEGMFYANPNSKTGRLENWSVRVSTRYRRVGDVAWTNPGDVAFTRSTSPARRGVVLPVARGQYEVQTRKHTGWGGEFVKDKIVWTALRSIKHAAPISFPKPLALIALRIRATDQLSGVINTFNCVTTSLVTAWNGSAWVANTASQNPADLFRNVLQGPANARPRPDTEIDLGNLQQWWAYCNAKGFKFNEVVTSSDSVYSKLCDIASAGRAVPTFIDGKWGVIWDRPSDPIVDHYTPRNSWGFGGQHTYAQQPHGWRVSFVNEDNGFTVDERIVYDDGYDKTNATLFEGINFPGVTNSDLIWKHGRFQIAQARLRPEKISLSVGWENLVTTRGDRVRVTHDILLVGIATARIKSVAGQVITFDEVVTLAAGQTYGVEFRVADDVRSFTRSVDPATQAGDYSSLTLVGDLSLVAVGTLVNFGKTNQVSSIYRIQSIAHQRDLIATLTLVDDAPDISNADSGAIPAYTPNITIPADPFSLPPRDLRYLEIIDGQGATARAIVRLTWQVPRFGKIVSFEVQQRDDDGGGSWVTVDSVLPPHTSSDVSLIASGNWSFRVRCIFADGTASAWASLINIYLAGLAGPPGNVTNLHQRSVAGQTNLGWDIVNDRRLLRYEVRKGTNWDTGLVVGNAVAQPPWPTTGDGTYHVRAYILTAFGDRVYSPATASITIADSIISRNIILSRDEQIDGWPGGLAGGVKDGSFIRTDIAAVTFPPWAQQVIDQLKLTGAHIAVYVSPSLVDIGHPAECRFWTEFEAVGLLQGDDYMSRTDVLASPDFLGAAPTRYIRAFPIWRFADTGDSDIFATSNIFNPTDVFNANINFLDWVAIATGTRVARYFVPGYVLITDQENVNAFGTKFRWFVDVPDRTDDYTGLSVPSTGLALTFYSGGYNAQPTPGINSLRFNGGPNGSLVPHVQRAIVNGTNGDEVKITNLTSSGCTVNVVNAGVNVARSGVNLLVRGY